MSPTTTIVLIDTSKAIHKGAFTISSENVKGTTGYWKVSQSILQGGISDGVELVEIDNGAIQIFILPTRGMGIWRLTDHEQTLGWKSPVRGPVHPKFVPLCEPTGLGWLEGFDELVVRCGLESNGPPVFDSDGRLSQPLHGRIANRPAHFLEVTIDENTRSISVKGIVEEARFHFQKLRLTTTISTPINSRRLTIDDKVENFGGTDAEMQLLYHINIGKPFLDAGSQIVIDPTQSVNAKEGQLCPGTWNTVGPPTPGIEEECYFVGYSTAASPSQVLLKNSKKQGVVVTFDPNSLPCFTIWKNAAAENDGYVVGLEPGTNFPNPRAGEKDSGRFVALSPGESWSTKVSFDWLIREEEIRAIETHILA